ncbi:expressed unknown protein [Seminavis robusta]|uniref:EamA domain-containing protein n=1 Tax=Seminavis robusta TaxID=568900 RepID=A0A9N8H918_9STRA|nr:expressed unknown protein [Seminavis robusta]|eukprot:Sro239_g095900.1 n/a (159) ;mRNA; r:43499-43975
MTTTNGIGLPLLSALCYGGSEVLVKVGTTGLAAHEVQLIKTIVTTLCFLGVAFNASGGAILHSKGFSSSSALVATCMTAGVCAFIGGLLKTTAIKNGAALGTVSALTAFYPAVAFVGSVAFFGEELKPNKVVGLGFALLSILAFSYEPKAAVKILKEE